MTGVVFALIEGRTYGWWERERPFSLFGLDWTASISPVPVAGAARPRRARHLRGPPGYAATAAGRPPCSTCRCSASARSATASWPPPIVSLGEFGLLFALPLWFQNVLGYSAFGTGLALLPLAVGSFLASGLGAPLIRRWGAARVVQLGVAAELVGVAGLGLVRRTGHHAGGPRSASSSCTASASAWPPPSSPASPWPRCRCARSGQGSGLQSTARQVGSALGIAVLGTVLFAGLGGILGDRLADQPGLSAGQRDQVVTAVKESAGAAIAGLAADPRTAPIAEEAKAAFSEATRYAAFAAAGFLLIAGPCLRLPPRTRRRRATAERPRREATATATPPTPETGGDRRTGGRRASSPAPRGRHVRREHRHQQHAQSGRRRTARWPGAADRPRPASSSKPVDGDQQAGPGQRRRDHRDQVGSAGR